jgi:hypothetical protein
LFPDTRSHEIICVKIAKLLDHFSPNGVADGWVIVGNNVPNAVVAVVGYVRVIYFLGDKVEVDKRQGVVYIAIHIEVSHSISNYNSLQVYEHFR